MYNRDMRKITGVGLLLSWMVGVVFGSGVLSKDTVSVKESDYILQTDDTVIKLVFSDKGILLKKLAAGEEGWNWAGEGSPVLLLEQYQLGDVNRPVKWKFVSAKIKSDATTKTVTAIFSDEEAKLTLKSLWTSHSGPGPIEHTIEVTNEGKSTVEIGYCSSLDMLLKMPVETVQHWWAEKGAGQPSKEGTHITKIEKDFYHKGVSMPYLGGNEPIPWQCVDAMGKYGFYTGIESTGCVMQRAKLEQERSLRVILGIYPKLTEQGMLAKLEPKEVYTFPTVFVGCYKGDIDDGCNRLHRWTERWLCPPEPDANMPLLTNNSWGGGMDVSEKLARRMIDAGASVGIEMYHLDAGWFRACGWWEPDPKKFPNEMKFVSDYAHSKGLKFGLWLAWTLGGGRKALAGGDNALSVFNPKMKNWFGEDVDPNWESPIPWEGKVVCLACSPAKEWCLDMLRKNIKDYKLDLLEHDIGLIVPDCIRTNHGHIRTRGDISNRCCESYYQIYDTLMKEFPNLLLENCVGGGRQTDFGVIKHTHYTCSTDVYDPLNLRKAFYDVSYPMPPRIIEGYISNRGETLENFRYCIRSAMLGWCTIMMDIAGWPEEFKADSKKQFEIYKKIIRPQVRDGNLYHVSDRPAPRGWDAFEYYTPATSKGIVMVFREKYEQPEITIKLKGLEPDAKYGISFEDGYGKAGTFTGKELMGQGINLNLPSYNSSEIIFLTRENVK